MMKLTIFIFCDLTSAVEKNSLMRGSDTSLP